MCRLISSSACRGTSPARVFFMIRCKSVLLSTKDPTQFVLNDATEVDLKFFRTRLCVNCSTAEAFRLANWRSVQSITKCDVFICCNVFSRSLLHAVLCRQLWKVHAPLLCYKWFSGAMCFLLNAQPLTCIAALSEAKAETPILIFWIMPSALINILLPQHLCRNCAALTGSWEAAL